MLFAGGFARHFCVLPCQDQMDRGQLGVPLDDIAGNGAWKRMAIGLLNLCQLFDQPVLLASTNRHLNLGDKHFTARVIDSPTWRFGAGSTRRVELELSDVLLR